MIAKLFVPILIRILVLTDIPLKIFKNFKPRNIISSNFFHPPQLVNH